MKSRLVIVGAVVALALAMMAPAAHAAPSPLLMDGGNGSSGTHRVRGDCAAGAGVTASLGTVTYVVTGRASSSTNDLHSVGVGTGLTCRIKDRDTGATYGSVSRAFPGPGAVVVGTITVPFNSDPYLCVIANTVFSDNHTASVNTC